MNTAKNTSAPTRATIVTGPHSQAQGDLIELHSDGCATIECNGELITGEHIPLVIHAHVVENDPDHEHVEPEMAM